MKEVRYAKLRRLYAMALNKENEEIKKVKRLFGFNDELTEYEASELRIKPLGANA